MIGWIVAMGLHVAQAQDLTCDLDELKEPPEQLSVAWVSPLPRRARGKAWLYVVPTTQLRTFGKEVDGSQGRVLQWLGMRRKDTPPRRRYKVVIFDTTAAGLCRPVEPTPPESFEPIAGVRPCDEKHRGAHRRYEGCGTLTDRATGKPSIEVYRARWNDLAHDGFCVLPLDRFLAR